MTGEPLGSTSFDPDAEIIRSDASAKFDLNPTSEIATVRIMTRMCARSSFMPEPRRRRANPDGIHENITDFLSASPRRNQANTLSFASFYFDGRIDRLRRMRTPSPNIPMLPAIAGSGTFARWMPLAAAKESNAAKSKADMADWLANWLKLSASSTKSSPLTVPL
jgi:hypothetical protein